MQNSYHYLNEAVTTNPLPGMILFQRLDRRSQYCGLSPTIQLKALH